MSTGCNCEFVEVEPGKWYYILEDTRAPKNAWDWREYAFAYGPFSTEDEANKHLVYNHANPGGSYSIPYVDGFKPDSILEQLIKEASRW